MTRRWFEDGSKESRYIHGGNTEGPRSAMRVLRYAAMLILMMVVGVCEMWGQTITDGLYYIASGGNDGYVKNIVYNSETPTTNYYLCPTENWYYYQSTSPYYLQHTDSPNNDNGMPFMTTYQCLNDNNYDSNKALWCIKKKGDTDYYYIIHVADGKYLTRNGKIGHSSNAGRMRIHLESSPADDDALFTITYVEQFECYDIKTKKSDGSSGDDALRQYLNVSGGNQNTLQANNKKTDGPKVNGSGSQINVGGIIGLWTYGAYYESNQSKNDQNSRWCPKSVLVKAPAISKVSANNTITITDNNNLPNCTIRYTIGDGSQADPTATTGSEYDPLNPPVITIETNVKAAIFAYGVRLSDVSNAMLNQTITLSDESLVYNGSEREPTVTLKYGDNTIPAEEYDVEYSDNTAVGTATVTVTNKANKVGGNFYVITDSKEFEITKAPLTVTANPKEINYGDTPANDGVTYSAFAGTETESVLTGTLAYNYNYEQYGNVGSYTITPSGLSSSNYNISFVAGTLTVNKKALTINAVAKSKTYGEDDPALTYTSDGLVNNDAITGTLTRDAGENVGTYAINQGSLTASNNYSISYTSANLTINPKEVTVTSGITASDKTYDGTTTATLNCTGAVFTGKIENDDLTLVSATGAFADKNVGTDKEVTITGLSFGGAAAGNYMLAETGNQSSIKASISAKDITASGTIAASNKVYDGTTTAVFDYSGVTLAGKVEGDNLSVTATGSFDDKYVGAGKTVTISGWALSGTDVGNYNLTGASISTTMTADITAKEITVSGITAENKVYNSTTAATLDYSGVTFAGKVDGDVLSITATGAFADANIGTGKTVNISGLTLGGADAGNYSLAGSGQQTETTADITAKAVTITAGSKSKNWDGDPLTWTSFTATALEEGDNHTFTVYMTAESTITNVGTTPNVIATVDGVAVTTGNETAVGNYLVTTVDGTLTITGSQNITITLTMGNSTYGSNTKNPNVTIMPKDAKDATRTFYYKVKDADDATYTTDKPTKISNAGTYTVKVVVDPYQSYNGGEATTDFTINKAPLQIQANNVSKEYLDPDPEITYAATGFVNDEIQDDILRGNLSRATGETIGDYVISNDNGNLTDVTNNYEISITSATFSIIPKSLGEGDEPAKGISIAIKEDSNSATGYTTTVSNNGKENLIENTDYTLVGTGSGDNYTVTITAKEGNGKYTGSAKATYGSFTFYQISNTEFIAPYIANETDLVTDGKVKPYIVRNVNPSAGTISITSVGYIPEGIPVLLLTDEEANGLTTAKKDDEIESISATALSLNKLKFSKGMTVETAQVYRFYRGEFVLTLSGSLPTGAFYLDNPNYNNPAPVASPSFLRIIINNQDEETGIVEIQNNEKESIQEDCWYTIDGYRLNGKPVKKGLYIKGRSKVFVK